MPLILLYSLYGVHRDLLSFPTRRSSDLKAVGSYTRRQKRTHMKKRLLARVLGVSAVLCLPCTISLADLIHDSRQQPFLDRKSTRLNSSHVKISYAVFCLKKKSRLRGMIR